MAKVVYYDADTNSSGDVTAGLKGNPPVDEYKALLDVVKETHST